MRKSMMTVIGLGMALGLAAAWARADAPGTAKGGAADEAAATQAVTRPAAQSASAPQTQPASAAEIARLIWHLGAESFKAREAAQQELVKIGWPAVDSLLKAAADDNAERSLRAQRALSALMPNTATISVPEAALTNMPIWLDAKVEGEVVIDGPHYPFAHSPWYMGRYVLEVRKDGRLLPARKINPRANTTSRFGGTAPPNSPMGRLPLHLAFSLTEPGDYQVRLLVFRDGVPHLGKPDVKTLLAVSAWVELKVRTMPPAEADKWIRKKINDQPTDVGMLVGDYLPSLLARPDDTVAGVLQDMLHHPDMLVQAYALDALAGYYGDDRLRKAFLAAIADKGPTTILANYLVLRKDLFAVAGPGVVETCIRHLSSGSANTVAASLFALMLLKQHYDWTKQPAVPLRIDKAVWDQADAIGKMYEEPPRRFLAAYLGTVKTAKSRKLLWKLSENKDTYDQAVDSLCRLADPADLPELAKILYEQQASQTAIWLPDHLYRGYGKACLIKLEEAFQNAPDERVRKRCEEVIKQAEAAVKAAQGNTDLRKQ